MQADILIILIIYWQKKIAMNNDKELTNHFQRCRKCGRWEPIEYKDNEQRHVCPINKNHWIPAEFKNGN